MTFWCLPPQTILGDPGALCLAELIKEPVALKFLLAASFAMIPRADREAFPTLVVLLLAKRDGVHQAVN